MPSARHWHGGLRVAAWLFAFPLVVGVRALLEAGILEARIDGQDVVIVSGLWSAGFATGLTLLITVAVVAMLGWLTYTWLAGSRDRRRRAAMTERPHRRPLI